MSDNPFRLLPAAHEVLQHEHLAPVRGRYSHFAMVNAIRLEIDLLRQQLFSGQKPSIDMDQLAKSVIDRLIRDEARLIQPVINATGVVLHTNLGRSPLAEEAALAAYEAGRGYLNLELDLGTGKRSSRQDPIRHWLTRLTGAESATAVNNCAAATMLTLRALAYGREVVVSRGQLIEIGGSFRIPEIMAASGAVLREVGTTNITRIGDYERAICSNTGLLMRIHPSNYRIRGFAKSASLEELVALGRKHQVPVVDDVGSGALVDLRAFNMHDEPIIGDSIACGVDLVLCSGDKLMGGSQAGIIIGRTALIEIIERDPMMRAVRLDKMTLAALEATLRLYLNPQEAWQKIPTLKMLNTPYETLRLRAETFASRLRERSQALATIEVIDEEAFVGGGSLPDFPVKTAVVAIKPLKGSDAQLSAELRRGAPPVVARVQGGRFLVDLRTVFESQEAGLLEALARGIAS